MKIKFPELSSRTKCQAISAYCLVAGEDLPTDDKELLVEFKKEKTWFGVSYEAASKKDHKFLYLVFSKDTTIPTGRMKKVSSSAISNFLEKFRDHSFYVGCAGRFDFDKKLLPAAGLISSLSIPTSHGGVSMHLKSGTVEMVGVPLKEFTWYMHGTNIHVSMETTTEPSINFTEDFLIGRFDRLQNLFKKFALGEGNNA